MEKHLLEKFYLLTGQVKYPVLSSKPPPTLTSTVWNCTGSPEATDWVVEAVTVKATFVSSANGESKLYKLDILKCAQYLDRMKQTTKHYPWFRCQREPFLTLCAFPKIQTSFN